MGGACQQLSVDGDARTPANDRDPAGLLQHDDTENQQQQQACWERFLLKETLNVLLVESDDSTRQVVSALLRCCMYQVISAENGQQAWAYLEDKRNNIDLVLTEVFMPGVSGISLLSRIMSHNICKNIPVIMMSSSDAMSTVFKCLSKGAVDFLVKPIRKNELKNLWQHVWRQRCHSSSGSGSESGIQTQKCTKSKGANESGNNSGSNDDEAGMGLNARDDSDNGSGTQAQNSWTKLAVEIDSPQAMSLDQLADPANSTCAQVIHSKSEICSHRWLPGSSNRNCKKQKYTNDDFKGKDLEIDGPGNLYMDHQSSPNERPIKAADHENNSKESMMGNLGDATVRAADLIGSMAKNMDAQQAARAADTPNFSSEVPEGKDDFKGKDLEIGGPRNLYMDHQSSPNERPIKAADHENNSKESMIENLEEPTVRAADLIGSMAKNMDTQQAARAAEDTPNFSSKVPEGKVTTFIARYHTSAASNQGGTGLVGSCSPHDNSSEAVKTDSTYNMKSNSDAAAIKQGSNGSSNNNDMGSTTKDVVTKPSTNNERVMLPSAIKANGYTSTFHPVQQWMVPDNATAGKAKADEVANNAGRNSHPGDVQSNLTQQHRPTLHYVHFENSGSGALQCGSSNVFDPPLEGQATNNYGVKAGSNSGSNKGQNNGSTAEERALDRRTGFFLMAVCHFQVRYQSRKRLADQRPRVRGQFVKQAVQNQEGDGER
ncbi:Two-component response regulator-like PRR37 [Zea mays]|uniref:Two-component response regulator-like PRR37 n=1 Tax=Zea mays TaxID=4577 RepID=A0A3L6E5Q4_MAIZE|nr:Two-component response regulator-like PRR37 [Zea mays]